MSRESREEEKLNQAAADVEQTLQEVTGLGGQILRLASEVGRSFEEGHEAGAKGKDSEEPPVLTELGRQLGRFLGKLNKRR